jgi:hypothetical protein
VTNLEPEGFAYPDPNRRLHRHHCRPGTQNGEESRARRPRHTSAAHQADLVARLMALGATPADPEGNEFDVLTPR